MFLRTRALVRASQLPAQLSSASTRLPNTRLPAIACKSSSAYATRQFSTTRSTREKTAEDIDLYVREIKEEWGEYLPEGLLSPKEFAVYERYFGAPLRMLKEGESPEDFLDQGAEEDAPVPPGTMTLETADGEHIEVVEEVEDAEDLFVREAEAAVGSYIKSEGNLTPQEILAYERLSRDISNAYLQNHGDAEAVEQELEAEKGVEQDGMPGSYIRAHPLTKMGRFTTFPSTVEPPEALVLATGGFLSKVSNKHLDKVAHKIYGEHLQNSPIATTGKKNNSMEFHIHPSKSTTSDLEADVHFATVMPGLHAQALSALAELRRRLGREWVLNDVQRVLDIGTGGAGIVAWQSVIDAEIAANGPRTSRDQKPTEEGEESVSESNDGTFKATVVVGSDTMRYRAAQFLDNTTFLPRIPDFHPSNPNTIKNAQKQVLQPRKYYDLVIATNTILPMAEDFKKKYHVENLWSLVNPNGGILLIIEKGTPSGFEAIAGARHHLLKHRISSPGSEFRKLRNSEPLPENPTDIKMPEDEVVDPENPNLQSIEIAKETGQIIAPCTNHEECPLFPHGPGVKNRKDFCHFRQKYIRPYYMQRVIKATGINHESLTYSYVALRRGKDTRTDDTKVIQPLLEDFDTKTEPYKSRYSEEELRKHFHTLPRVLWDPFKRHQHVTMDLCTSEGRIERWTVPQSLGKLEYHDARKSQWGDLWALGAKTKRSRNIRPGIPMKMKAEFEKGEKKGSGKRNVDKVERRMNKNNWKRIWLEAKKAKKKAARIDKAALGGLEEAAWRKERSEKNKTDRFDSRDMGDDMF